MMGAVRKLLQTTGALAAVAALGVADATAGTSSPLPRGSEPVNLDPADFTTKIDNPYSSR